MTTLSGARARRAFLRLTGACSLPAPQADRPVRWTLLRLSLPLPAATDSRVMRPILSTSTKLDWARALDLAGLLGAAVGAVALLSALCR